MGRLFWIIGLALVGINGNSQLKEPSDSARIILNYFRYNPGNFNSKEEVDYLQIDRFDQYVSTSVVNVGNIGQDAYSLLPNLMPNFQFWSLLSKDRFGDIIGRSKLMPITNTRYILGMRGEQNFSISHSQNFANTLSISLLLDKTVSEGFYTNQFARDRDFNVSLSYNSPIDKYNAALTLLSDLNFRQLNGGITSDSLFEADENRFVRKSLFPVLLQSAECLERNNKLSYYQDFTLYRKDSSNKLKLGSYSYARQVFRRYSDGENDAIFDNYYLDSTGSYDSVGAVHVGMDMFVYSKGRKLNFKLGGAVNYFEYTDSIGVTSGNDSYFYGSIKPVDTGRLVLDANAKYYPFGYHKSNFWLAGSGKLKLMRNLTLRASLAIGKETPAIDMQRYSSNHFWWENDFNPSLYRSGMLTVNSGKLLELGYSVQAVDNGLYFDTLSLPRQLNQSFSLNRFWLGAKTVFFHRLKISGQANYQRVVGPDNLGLPNYFITSRLDWKFKLYSMIGNIGGSVQFWTHHYANSYQPALGQFYNQGEKQIGNYPYIHLHLNGRIKSVRFFFLVSHANYGFAASRYYAAPNYPIPDRSFKFGISWTFLY